MEEDKDKVIDLFQRLRERESKSGRKKGPIGPNAHRVRMFKEMAKEAIREEAPTRLTEQETMFCELVVNGAALASAYEQAFPDKCFRIALQCTHKADQPCTEGCETLVPIMSYEQTYARANHLTKKGDVRSTIIGMLDQEEDAVSHTSSRLDNFILKSLEREANNMASSASARIAALKALSEHRAVQAAESRTEEKAKRTSEDVLTAIQDKIGKVSNGKGEL